MRTLIIGTGISAAAFAATTPRAPGERRTAVGGPQLWNAARIDPHHAMGQPPNLLTGHVLRGPQTGAPTAPGGFMKAGAFSALTEQVLADHVETIVPVMVRSISRARPPHLNFKVEYRTAREPEYFNQVVIAVGPGTNRQIRFGKNEPAFNPADYRGHVITGDEFMSPEWKRPDTVWGVPEIAIYGGSATAAWIAELALARKMKVAVWFTRQGDKADSAWDAGARFADAFPPGGRNLEVKRELAHLRKVLNLTGVTLRSKEGKCWLRLDLEGPGKTRHWYLPDILVYALGYEHTSTTGAQAMLDPPLRDELIPFFDRNRAISERQCLLAVGTPNKDLLIVGSAMSSRGGLDAAKLGDQIAPYRDIGLSLPEAARPTEGIAMVMAGIEAFNEFMPARAVGGMKTFRSGKTGNSSQHPTQFKWDINVNTCNRTQLAACLAQTTDLPPFAANLTVELVMRLRNKTVFGGMTEQKVAAIANWCDNWCKTLKDPIGRPLGAMLNERGLNVTAGRKLAHLHEDVAEHIVAALG